MSEPKPLAPPGPPVGFDRAEPQNSAETSLTRTQGKRVDELALEVRHFRRGPGPPIAIEVAGSHQPVSEAIAQQLAIPLDHVRVWKEPGGVRAAIWQMWGQNDPTLGFWEGFDVERL